VGAGGGSIAEWLAGQVGPDGRVLATDIDTRFLEQLSHKKNVEVRRHDIVSDSLPERAFDLVHARLVLLHLPERDRVLGRMAAALKPGGWLLTEEFVRLGHHVTVFAAAVVLFAVNYFVRAASDHDVVNVVGLVLTLVGLAALTVSGWLGGKLAYRFGVRVADEDTQAEGFR
jgi:2-polyprenyl-3-methyl-5-hydroxy-6-metoxy-1,4-benzoquinol methylase